MWQDKREMYHLLHDESRVLIWFFKRSLVPRVSLYNTGNTNICTLVTNSHIVFIKSLLLLPVFKVKIYITGVGSGAGARGACAPPPTHTLFLLGGSGMFVPPHPPHPPPPLLTPHFHFPFELYVYITLTNNYLGFFIYQLIILWTISINWHRWLLVNNHISKYNSFILVLYRTTSGKLVPTLVEVTTFPSWWRTMGLLLLKGFKDGSWRRQTGINSSIYAALVCNNLPLQMLMTPCLASLPSWRTLQKKLFLRLRQYQNVSINYGFLTFAKMQSKSATGPLRGSNVNYG